MSPADLVGPNADQLGLDALRVLAGLITGFAILLGLALFICGFALVAAEVVGSVRSARRHAEGGSPVREARVGR